MTKKLLLAFILSATAAFGTQCEDCCYDEWRLEANVGYFYPFSKPLRDVISGGVDYQLQLTYKWSSFFGAFVSGDFFYKDGHSTGSGNSAGLWILPLTVGVKASADFWQSADCSKVLQGYCLLGPRWYFVRANNSASYLEPHNYAQGFGGVGGIGLSWLYNAFTVNAFLNASFGNVHADSSKRNVQAPNTQVGGLVAGAGLGWSF